VNRDRWTAISGQWAVIGSRDARSNGMVRLGRRGLAQIIRSRKGQIQ
jgi:hypothetical protein